MTTEGQFSGIYDHSKIIWQFFEAENFGIFFSRVMVTLRGRHCRQFMQQRDLVKVGRGECRSEKGGNRENKVGGNKYPRKEKKSGATFSLEKNSGQGVPTHATCNGSSAPADEAQRKSLSNSIKKLGGATTWARQLFRNGSALSLTISRQRKSAISR